VLVFSISLTNLEVSDPREDCFFRLEKDIDLAFVLRFGLCVPIDYNIKENYCQPVVS